MVIPKFILERSFRAALLCYPKLFRREFLNRFGILGVIPSALAIAGAAHAMMAVLIGPIFDRVLDPSSPDLPVELFKLPFASTPIYLRQLVPNWIHNVWVMVAFAILCVFLIRGICDYFGNYLVTQP